MIIGCPACGNSEIQFYDDTELLLHCHECDDRFSEYEYLYKHMAEMHQIYVDDKYLPEENSSRKEGA